MEFQNKNFNAEKPRQYEEVRKEIVEINEFYVEYFGPVSLPLFPSDMDDNEETRLFERQRKLANEKIKLGCKCIMEKVKKLRNAFCNHRTTNWV